jgi:hypothetical protein
VFIYCCKYNRMTEGFLHSFSGSVLTGQRFKHKKTSLNRGGNLLKLNKYLVLFNAVALFDLNDLYCAIARAL